MRRRARSLPDREVKAEEAGDGSKSAPLIRYTFVEVAEPSRGTGARRRRVQSSPPELTGHTTEARQAVPSPRVERPEETETRTTVVIRGMPHALTRAALLEAMDGNGFRGAYDFVYLPIEFNTGKNFGYAFVNFVGPAKAKQFLVEWKHFEDWGVEHGIETENHMTNVKWSRMQHYDEHVRHYQNSPVMHQSVRDDCKPVVFKNGERQRFPSPTKKISALRRLRTQRGVVKELQWKESDDGAPRLDLERCRISHQAARPKQGDDGKGAAARGKGDDGRGAAARGKAGETAASGRRRQQRSSGGPSRGGGGQAGAGAAASRPPRRARADPSAAAPAAEASASMESHWWPHMDEAFAANLDFLARSSMTPYLLQGCSTDTSYFDRRDWQRPTLDRPGQTPTSLGSFVEPAFFDSDLASVTQSLDPEYVRSSFVCHTPTSTTPSAVRGGGRAPQFHNGTFGNERR